jgi:hypothetical protein
MKLNCIICAAELENFDLSEITVHPICGTVFRTYGHYGSTVFDPMDASYLEIVVCDECLNSRLAHTYKGVDKKYRQQIEERQEELTQSFLNLI